MESNGAAPQTLYKSRWLLLELAKPITNRPIKEITAAEILDILKRIERTGRRETARRLRGTIGSVFRYAVVTLRAQSDPTMLLHGALLRPNVKPRAAITDERLLGQLLNSIDGFEGWPIIGAGLKFLALTFARPGEVRGALWSEISFEKKVWRIASERTKMRKPHDVPLSRQAIAVLRSIQGIAPNAEYVFPSLRHWTLPLSDNTFNASLRRLGYTQDEVTAHGFRASASTILNENGYNPDVIEAALAHQEPNAIRRAYNRAAYWPERVELMQVWADMLDAFKADAADSAAGEMRTDQRKGRITIAKRNGLRAQERRPSSGGLLSPSRRTPLT